jgi:23S rRNA (uracil1939-C5)-methyltransferase
MARRQRLPRDPVETTVAGFSHEGRGIAHVNERTLFLRGGLAGERVRFVYTKRRRSRDEGRVVEVLEPAPQRIEPRCRHFGDCGGCSLQHLPAELQIEHKAGVLAEHFRHIGKVEPRQWLEPLRGPVWGYRRKARLGVKFVPRKGDRVLVGFREAHSPFVADLELCHVLDPRVGERLPALADLIGGLSIRDRVAQIEVALGDDGGALVLRNLAPFSDADRERLLAFEAVTGLRLCEQPGNESTVAPLSGEPLQLSYRLPEFDVELGFHATDFTQVNADINGGMVSRALELLDPGPGDRVLDLFCGLGNFTLPLARRAGQVIGVEGAEPLVHRGRENAVRNGLDNIEFHAADLTRDISDAPWLAGGIDLALLDPPRSGAIEVLENLARMAPRRIVYVSCGPATLARDAGELVHRHGYRLQVAGVMDMFPHTAHVESIALFERPV